MVRADFRQQVFAAVLVCGLILLRSLAAQEASSAKPVYEGWPGLSLDAFEGEIQEFADRERVANVFDQGQLPARQIVANREFLPSPHLRIIRPYDGAVFPARFAPPMIRWEDPANNAWLLTLLTPDRRVDVQVITDQRAWRPSSDMWRRITAQSRGEWIQVEVRGCVAGRESPKRQLISRACSRFRVSKHAADPLIVYRLVSPLFHADKTPDVNYRYVENFKECLFLPGKGAYCSNCHVFPGSPPPADGGVDLAIAIRGSVGSDRRLGLFNFKSKTGRTLPINSFFMTWDPSGRYVAVTGGKKVVIRTPITLQTQEFHVMAADIVIVDARTFEARKLPGAADPLYAEAFPSWSLDGKTIVFARTPEIDLERLRIDGFPGVKYDLYSVPYNGGRGGVPVPVKGASNNGKSNFAPRHSPDGKWLVFTQADRASLVEPSADLWIRPADDADAPSRRLECNYAHAMDSHHGWSSNGKWLLFATKRDDGIFARIYFTEIDDHGTASPPVALPLLIEPMMCFNIPEFLRSDPGIDAELLFKVLCLQEGRKASQ